MQFLESKNPLPLYSGHQDAGMEGGGHVVGDGPCECRGLEVPTVFLAHAAAWSSALEPLASSICKVDLIIPTCGPCRGRNGGLA